MKNRILLALLLLASKQAFMSDSESDSPPVTPQAQITAAPDSGDESYDTPGESSLPEVEVVVSSDDSDDQDQPPVVRELFPANGEGESVLGSDDPDDDQSEEDPAPAPGWKKKGQSFGSWAKAWLMYFEGKVTGCCKSVKGKVTSSRSDDNSPCDSQSDNESDDGSSQDSDNS